MKITKLSIKNLFGLEEFNWDGADAEFKGENGVGKTSIIDSIRYALQNDSERDYIIKNGASEGEILIETDSGLNIHRKKRNDKADYKKISNGDTAIAKPEAFLKEIFTPLQLNPVEFLSKDKKEQNRIILDLIKFDWDMKWIEEQFGEIPRGVEYDQNILNVLHDIQSEKGNYYNDRQDLNREARNKKAMIDEIMIDIPENYNYENWKKYDVGVKYQELEKARTQNDKIRRASNFKNEFEKKEANFKAEKENKLAELRNRQEKEFNETSAKISEYMAKIKELENSLEKNREVQEKEKELIEQEYNNNISTLNEHFKLACDITETKAIDTKDIEEEIEHAKNMQKHVGDYERVLKLTDDIKLLTEQSNDITDKIEKARALPGEILEVAEIPVTGISVKDGIALINGLPISNLSTGEKLKLCVDVATAKESDTLKIILIDGVESLSDDNKTMLFDECKKKGLQIIATTTTNDKELNIVYL